MGNATEALALRVKDYLEDRGLPTFFDGAQVLSSTSISSDFVSFSVAVDNLKQVTMSALTLAVEKSCSVLLFLDSESMSSTVDICFSCCWYPTCNLWEFQVGHA